MTLRRSRHALPLVALALAACGRAAPMVAPTPVAAAVSATPAPPLPLPAVPPVDGPLALTVVYPPAGSTVTSRDSNFILGSIGSGRATLTINGVAAHVAPNGAFIGWLANPPADAPRYELVAVRGADTARATHTVRISSRMAFPTSGRLVVDSANAAPRGPLWRRDDELVRVSLRAPANAAVWLRAGSESFQLRPASRDSTTWALDVPARALRGQNALDAEWLDQRVHVPIATIERPERADGLLRRVRAGHLPGAVNDTDWVINGRPQPGETYRWMLFPGTALDVTGREGDFWRVRLDGQLEIFVPVAETDSLPSSAFPVRRIAGNVRVRATAEYSDVVVPVGEKPAYFVEQRGDRTELTLYGTQGNTDAVNYALRDSLVRSVEWVSDASDRVRFTVATNGAPFGYLVLWERGSVVLRLRRAPVIDRSRPLAGLVIVVDPGHPPAGATGPTGLYEPQATLPVGERLRRILIERGATVVMTRTTAAPVALYDRAVIARRANGHAFVSIHLNAYPDGVNPFTAPNGSGTYFYRPQSEPLARAVQRALLPQLGLADEGVLMRSFAVVRQTWMPSVLTEGAFVIIPEQEAAMRTPEYQERYARGVADGLEAYFRALGASRP
ncbi:MAG: cell wall hydrolase/autolysin [Gemmatimonadetes bacterium]|nr:cell wall hydrolase/autolysin [Gemmatimonadota bacterium]